MNGAPTLAGGRCVWFDDRDNNDTEDATYHSSNHEGS